VVRDGNPSVQRDFLQIIGSNFTLKDRSLLFTTRKPFSIVAERLPDEHWLPIADRLRDYFKGSLEVENFQP